MPRILALLAVALLSSLTACAGSAGPEATAQAPPALVLGGIPDQDVALLQERFDGVAAHLSRELGLPVRYAPATSYAALVTAFANGDVQLGWFGGLTGVQARRETPGAEAVAQRPLDTRFRSVFIAEDGVPADGLAGLARQRFTFGSESSTSGHLMPRFFLQQAGVDPERDFAGRPGYSGSHDTTWKLVEAGSFQAGALNAAVWDRAVAQGQVDTAKVREIARTPEYVDYHWVVHPDVDRVHGAGTRKRIVDALLTMHDAGPEAEQVLELFDDTRFVPAADADYAQIEQVARSLGLLTE